MDLEVNIGDKLEVVAGSGVDLELVIGGLITVGIEVAVA